MAGWSSDSPLCRIAVGHNGYWIQDANLLSVSYAVGGLQVSGTWVGVKIDPFSLLAYGRVSQTRAKLGNPGRRDCGSLHGLLSCAFIQVHGLCRFMMVPDVLFPFQCIVRTVLEGESKVALHLNLKLELP